MKLARCHWLMLWLALGGGTLPARDVASYRVGDIAEANLVAPAAFDWVDHAGAARQAAEALKVPVIFRDFPRAATNALAADFSSTFATTRATFLAAARKTFVTWPLDEPAIAAPEFGKFLTAFNVNNPWLPVSAELAAQWARGGDGAAVQAKWLGQLLQIMHRPVRADDLPADFLIGDTFRVVSVSRPEEAPSLAAALENGKLIAATNLVTVSRLRMLFRHSFSAADQPLATALAAFLRPLCAPDAGLTQQARSRVAAAQPTVEHFVAGQLIARRGTVIDERLKALLDQMQAVPVPPAREATAAPAAVEAAPQPPLSAVRNRDLLLLTALSVVSVISVIAVFIAWRALRLRSPVAVQPGRFEPESALAASYAPQISQAVKEALVQELAATRVELFKAQQAQQAQAAQPVPPPAPPAGVARPSPSPSQVAEPKPGGLAAATPREDCVASVLAEAQALSERNEFERALKCFDAALAMQPGRAETLVKMGGVLDKLGRTDEALACFDRALAVDDTLTVAYLQKGGVFNRLARYEEASQCYEKALLRQKKAVA